MEYLTVKAFAQLASLHPETVRDWLRQGIIKGQRIGARPDSRRAVWRIPEAELARLLAGDSMGARD